jgi:hypothetical protein
LDHKSLVLQHNGGFFITCTLHKQVDFKANALNNVHVSQRFHYKAGLLDNHGIIIYSRIKNKLIANGYKSQNNTWPSVPSG